MPVIYNVLFKTQYWRNTYAILRVVRISYKNYFVRILTCKITTKKIIIVFYAIQKQYNAIHIIECEKTPSNKGVKIICYKLYFL
jgi:hypothetical protein